MSGRSLSSTARTVTRRRCWCSSWGGPGSRAGGSGTTSGCCRSGSTGWWASIQEAAVAIRTFEIQYVPGLLQTPAYARAVVERGLPTAPSREVERRVELRVRRSALLRRTAPPQLWAILDESVLLRVLESREVMREQLAHLVAMAALPHVTVQIVPLDVTNASSPAIPVTYLRFGGLDLPDIVYLEHIRSATFLEDRDETEEYRVTLDRLADEALDPRASLAMLRETLDQRYRTP